MYAPTSIKKIWIISFEYSGIARIGGLGEAVKLISEELAKRGLEVTVIMPSHGIYPQGFREIDIVCRGERYGVDGNIYSYDVVFLEGYLNNVRIVLIKGRDHKTSAVIDTWPVYSYVDEKTSILARACLCLAKTQGFPDIVHVNDWHSAIAGTLLKTIAELEGYALPTLYQIHLRGSPSYPWHYASEAWSGIPNVMQRIWVVYKHERISTEALWNSCWGNIECFIVKLSDAITCVSRSEVENLAKDYGEWIKGKTCYAYNSTSWSIKEVEEIVKKIYGSTDRVEIRWKIVENIIEKNKFWGYLDLRYSDVLVVSSGRLTSQKGFDILLQAAKHLPYTVKIIILGKSVGDVGYENYLRWLLSDVNGKIIVVHDDLDIYTYKAIIYAAHTYVLPSRYEPFGIVAIEALALGTPLVVTNVGGPSEYVNDIRFNVLGLGVKVPPENSYELAKAIQSLGYLMLFSETGAGFDKIIYKELRDIVSREPNYGNKLREFLINYVETYFRPKHMVNNILSCYQLARQMAYYRSYE